MCRFCAFEQRSVLVLRVALRFSAEAAWFFVCAVVLVRCEAGFVFLLFRTSTNHELLWPTVGADVKVFSKVSATSTCPDLQLRFAGLQIPQAPNFQVRFGLCLGARVAAPL